MTQTLEQVDAELDAAVAQLISKFGIIPAIDAIGRYAAERSEEHDLAGRRRSAEDWGFASDQLDTLYCEICAVFGGGVKPGIPDAGRPTVNCGRGK